MYHIAFASDNGYSLQLKISVASLLYACRYDPSDIVVDILDDGINNSSWHEMFNLWHDIAPTITIRQHKISSESFSDFRSWKGSLTAYARLLLPDMLTDEQWCLYADCDTFFIRNPKDLWHGLRACDYIVGHEIANGRQTHGDVWWLRERGFDPDPDRYVCSGFLMMNLDAFRRYELSKRCTEFLSQHPDSITADQPAINVACKGHIGLMPSGWGIFMDETMILPSCGCIHFAGIPPWKPQAAWTHYCGEHELFDIWFDFSERICHLDLRSAFQSKAAFPRLVAKITYPLLVLLSFSRAYPRRFAKHAAAIRQRTDVRAPKRIRQQLELV